MTRGLGAAVRAVRAGVAPSGTSDRELLARFAGGEEAAFAHLVRRHSGMVLGVCRRVLPCVHDAEDATQAVFLVLAKKARGGRWQASVANWLYTAARRAALKVRRASLRRARREGDAAPPPDRQSALDRMTGREAFAALDGELDALPAIYREPLVLCCLQGLTRDEAAGRLRVPAATLKSRLDRGRKRLAAALAARGIASGAAVLAAVAATPAEACTPRLAASILATVGGSASPAVAALAQEIAVNSWIKPILLGAVLTAAAAVVLAGMTSPPTATADDKHAMTADRPDGSKKEAPPTKAAETVTVRVVDPDGKPVAGATVYRRGYSFSGATPGAEVKLGRTAADGVLAAEWKPLTAVHAAADGFCATAGGYRMGPADVTIRLAKPLPIKGRLVDLQGKPVPNAKVVVESVSAAPGDDLTAAYNAYRVNPESGPEAFEWRLDGKATGAPRATATDTDGRFELDGVGRLRVVHLRFEADGIEAARAAVFADPEFAKRMTPPTDAEKEAGGRNRDDRAATHGPEFTHAARPDHVITGTVTDAATGKPVKGVRVAGTAGDVGQTFSVSPWQDTVEATTDADGKFRLAGLVKAKRRFLHLTGSDAAPYLDHIAEVADSEGYAPAVADVKLRPAVVVRGRLSNKATGKPVAGEAQWLPLTTNEPLLKGQDDDTKLYTSQLGNTWPSGSRSAAGADGRFTLRVPAGPGVVLARCDQFDPAAAFAPARVREEDRKHLRKDDKDPDAVDAGGPKDRAGEEFFDTVMLVTPLRWENGYVLIDPDAKAKTVDATIEFDPGATVTLAAADADGKPVGGVTVVGPGRYGLSPPTFAEPAIAVGGIDPKGRPVQHYLLHKDRKLCGAVAVKGDEKGPVAVKMQACGSVSGTVVDHAGKPVKGAVVGFQMTDAVADDLLRQKLYRGEHEVCTDAGGKFAFPRLFPDQEFDLFVSLPGFRVGAAGPKRVTLKPGEAKDVGEFKLLDPKKAGDE